MRPVAPALAYARATPEPFVVQHQRCSSKGGVWRTAYRFLSKLLPHIPHNPRAVCCVPDQWHRRDGCVSSRQNSAGVRRDPNLAFSTCRQCEIQLLDIRCWCSGSYLYYI